MLINANEMLIIANEMLINAISAYVMQSQAGYWKKRETSTPRAWTKEACSVAAVSAKVIDSKSF